MITISITVKKISVYDEVAKTTAYTGKKAEDDGSAYRRIFATDSDRNMLERFWREACSFATSELKRFIVSVNEQPESHGVDLDRDYELTLEVSSAYDENLTDSIAGSLFSYFVSSIVSKWYKFANKEEAADYATMAGTMLNDVMQKIFYRKKPTRVKPGATT
ncbi:MAG: hypothetical protein Q4E59_00670 [Bacteroidales bacterium]|nr:hypothetical protein [Bacteroidales bacterium]